MASPERTGKPYCYVTWLTDLLAGQSQCTFRPWVQAHFQIKKTPDPNFNVAAWSADHKRLLLERATQLVQQGYKITTEGENAFKITGESAILAGKPDILGIKPGLVIVSDAKTGAQKNQDFFQVLLYLFALPMAFPELCHGRQLQGEVVYKGTPVTVVPVPGTDLTADRRREIIELIKEVGSAQRPEARPSEPDCRWCPVTVEDCPVRFGEGSAVPVTTSEF